MTLNQFKDLVAGNDPDTLAGALMIQPTVCALPDPASYNAFKARVSAALPESEEAFVVGSGNWEYSLNPNKLWNSFHAGSDIDVAVISGSLFKKTWERMRALHRSRWHLLGAEARLALRRNGENVYAGFVSPLWLPHSIDPEVYRFTSMLNRLSGADIGYRQVTMMYFKDRAEAVDYYKRGFRAARREI
jgi:hypothetical protein